MRPVVRGALLSILLAMAAGAAWSQADPRGARPPLAEIQARHEAHERQRAEDLRTVLRLRLDQEPALAAYLQAHKPPPGPPPGPPPEREALTTPQRLDEMARREAERAAAERGHADALRAFYAALTPEQRQVFDALQRLRHAPGPDHGGPWGHPGFDGPHNPPFDGPPDG